MYPITAAYAILTFIPPSSVSSIILPAIVCAASAYLRLWSFKTLGNLFTYSVTIRKDHSLISDGPYKWLVHPSYTGFFGCVWSYFWVWGLRDYRLWGLVVVVMTVPLVMRVWSEEKALETEFGKDKWKRHVRGKWRLVPFVF
ncbi:hypothetical protein BKA69DRAFT_1106104 [Paraphysoderma sedebokerense]|nr:hypothetical protein BKA69DRAFT_1106104 [Paraphysoderma sedebokerense]